MDEAAKPVAQPEKHAASARKAQASVREANEVDFWRGVALISIFINHIPGNFLGAYTHRNIGLSDSAELFVFLAGWSVRYLSESRSENLTDRRLLARLGARAFTLYCAHILIIMLAIAMLAGAALLLDQPLILQWHNAAAVFTDPITTHIGIVLLTHQLGYFDILPLYVVLMLLAPVMVLIHRYAPAMLVPASLAIYLATIFAQANIPTWPTEGRWFFNPLAWQLNFVLGFSFAKPTGLGKFVRERRRLLQAIAVPILLLGFVMVWWQLFPNPLRVPYPQAFFTLDKTFLSPLRLAHLLSLCIVVGGLFVYISRFAQPVASYFSLLGRNSLHVFCLGSLLSLAGQIARLVTPISIVADIIVVLIGVVLMTLIAWLNEWRIRL